MGIELAKAFVRIRGDSRGLKGDLKSVRAEVTNELRNISIVAAGILGTFATAGAGIIAGGFRLAAQFEQTTIAFSTILGSADLAKKKLDELASFAARTPFTIPGVENAARGLIAVGFSADELLPTLKALGDVSAGLGRGEEGLRRLVLNLGQVKAQAKLTGRELRDFTILGVPLLEELAKILGVAKDQIFSLTQAGDISSEVVTQAFKNMSSAGGRFEDLMFKINKTVQGQFSNLIDEIVRIGRTFGKELIPATKAVVAKLINLAQSIREVIKGQGAMIAGTLVGATAFASLGTAIFTASIAMRLFGITLRQVFIGTGIGAIIIAIGAAVGFLIGKLAKSKRVMELVSEIAADFSENLTKLSDTFSTAFSSAGFIVDTFFTKFTTMVVGILDLIAFLSTNWKLTWELMNTSIAIELLKMTNSVLNFSDTVRAIFIATVKTSLGFFTDLATGIGDLFFAVVDTITGLFKGLFEGIKSKFQGGDFFEPFMDEFTKAIANIEGEFPNLFAEAGKRFTEEFEKASKGPKDPFKDAINDLEQQRGELARQIAKEREENRKRRKEDEKDDDKPPPRRVGPIGSTGLDIKPGRTGFAEFGNTIQDAILKGKNDLDKKRNSLLQAGNVIQQKILDKKDKKQPTVLTE